MLLTHPSPHLEAPTCLFSLEMLRTKECASTPFVVFSLGLAFESFKEFGGVSIVVTFTMLFIYEHNLNPILFFNNFKLLMWKLK
jgi:hypothetical protein